MKWVLIFFAALFGLWVLSLVVELMDKIWNQAIIGRIQIENDQGAMDRCQVANEILGHKKQAILFRQSGALIFIDIFLYSWFRQKTFTSA